MFFTGCFKNMKAPQISYISFARSLPMCIYQYDCSLVDEWNYTNSSIPHWRCWYNSGPGGFVDCEEGQIALNERDILLIPPSVSLNLHNEQPFRQLYIHFSMSWELQHSERRIYRVPASKFPKRFLEELIRPRLQWDSSDFLNVYAFLCRAVALLPNNILSASPQVDERIAKMISRFELTNNFNYTNRELAQSINVSESAFIKLFESSIGLPPQFYLRRQRIKLACRMLHFSDATLDEIASSTGFVDRFHFSRVFKNMVGVSPAKFRKERYLATPCHVKTSDPFNQPPPH